MLILKKHPHPILKKNLTGITSTAADIRHHLKDILRICREHSGIGLSANQLGLEENFFFVGMNAKLRDGKKVSHICINPTWEPRPNTRTYAAREGCLSLPGRDFEVTRYAEIIASWDTAMGHPLKNVKLKGVGAQVFQHEHDHLRGLTLLDTGKEVL